MSYSTSQQSRRPNGSAAVWQSKAVPFVMVIVLFEIAGLMETRRAQAAEATALVCGGVTEPQQSLPSDPKAKTKSHVESTVAADTRGAGPAVPANVGRISFDVLVTGEVDGRPIPGATVRAFLDPDERRVTTGKDGIAHDLRSGSANYQIVVDAWADGYQSKRHSWSNRIGSTVGPLPATAKFELKRGELTIGGRIVDEAGESISGVDLELQGMRKGENNLAFFDIGAHTGVDGRWSSSSMPETLSSIGMWVHHPDFLPPVFSVVDDKKSRVQTMKEQKHVLVLKRGVRVEGKVLDQDGRPIVAATIKRPMRLGIPIHRSATSDAAGHFVLPSASRAGEPLTLLTIADGFSPDLRTISPAAGMASVDVRLAPGNTIRGRAIDQLGKPVADAWVVAGKWRGWSFSEILMVTDGDGRFVWHSAPADPIAINVSRWDYGGEAIDATASLAEYNWKLKPTYAAELIVVDSATGRLIKRFEVARGRFNDSGAFTRDERKDTNLFGSALVSLEAPAFTWRLLVTAQGYQPFEARVMAKGQGQQRLEIKLIKRPHGAKGCPSGMVVDANGKPLSDAEVMLATPTERATLYGDSWWSGQGVISWSGVGTVVSDNHGLFTFSPIDEDYKLGVVADIGYGEADRAELERTRRITVQRWGKIEGQVMRGGKPLPHSPITVRDDVRKVGQEMIVMHQTTASDLNGRFTLSRMKPGTVELVSGANHAKVNVMPGETARVQLGE
jgi:hypothetical protein